jgi:hypothetical protein
LDVILSMWQCVEVVGTCDILEDSLEWPTSHFLMLDFPKKGQRLPQKGLTSHLLLILCHFSRNSCKNSENFVVSLVGYFNDLYFN